MNMKTSGIGTIFKLNVSISGLGALTMDDVDFECDFYVYSNKRQSVKKEQMIRIDENNYIAIVYSDKLGVGSIKNATTIRIPDGDIPDGIRVEVANEITTVRTA